MSLSRILSQFSVLCSDYPRGFTYVNRGQLTNMHVHVYVRKITTNAIYYQNIFLQTYTSLNFTAQLMRLAISRIAPYCAAKITCF